MLLWKSFPIRRSRFSCFRLQVEALEDRTLLSFITAPSYAAGSSPYSVAVGDFNGDGIPDLAVANPGFPNSTVSILLGKGDGSFRAPVSYPLDSSPYSLAVADLNGDGKLDLVVANGSSNTVSILLGNGDGTFQRAQNYVVGADPVSVAVGDFNGDGIPDLAVANAGPHPSDRSNKSTVSLLLGNGDGTFQASRTFEDGTGSNCIAVGDFNGDGKEDIVTSNFASDYDPRGGHGGIIESDVRVFLGNGDGTFQLTKTYAFPFFDGPTSVAVADFNGDGIPDLAVAGYVDLTRSTVSVLLGKGDGTFQASHDYAVGTYPHSVAVGDFNGDGHFDVAVVNSFDASASVLLGNGDGTFQAARNYAVGAYPVSVAVGDFKRDGHLDLAVANFSSNTVSILLGKGDGTFQGAPSYSVGTYLQSLAVADFNGDGISDLAVTSLGPVSILLGKGDGTFQAAKKYRAGVSPQNVAVGDFNGDGIPDLAVPNFDSDTVTILLGNGDGTFQPPLDYAVRSSPRSVAVGDFNGDGHLDLAVAGFNLNSPYEGTASILLGNGDGTFQAARTYAAGLAPFSLAVGDFNSDGHLDLVVANYESNTVSVLLGNGDGTFQAKQDYAVDYGAHSVAVGDFNGDGIPDLAVAGSFGVSILLGNSDGTFQATRNYAIGYGPGSVAVGDFNHDGIPDLVVTSLYPNTVSILLGKGDGTFQLAHSYAVANAPGSVAVGDFNGDGFPDVALISSHSSRYLVDGAGTVTILLNAADWGGNVPIPPRRPAPHPTAHGQPQPASVSGLLAASQPEPVPSLPPASTDLQPNPQRQWLLETKTSPAAREGTLIHRPLFTARCDRDAFFEGWGDPIADMLGVSLFLINDATGSAA